MRANQLTRTLKHCPNTNPDPNLNLDPDPTYGPGVVNLEPDARVGRQSVQGKWTLHPRHPGRRRQGSVARVCVSFSLSLSLSLSDTHTHTLTPPLWGSG